MFILLLSAMLVASPFASARAVPASQDTTTVAAAAQAVTIRVVQARPSVSPTGTLEADVVTNLTADAEYFEVRLRLKSEDGRLLYQKTEVRHDVKAGEQTISFTRELSDHSLKSGRYPIEVRVLATGSTATEATSRLLVLDKTPPTVPVAIIVRLTCSPGVDPNGRFLVDPAQYPETRDDAELLADLVETTPGLKMSFAISPLLVEEWARAADGYETSGADGVRSYAETSEGSVASQAVLDRLRALLGGDQVELLDVPYAEPDIAGLASIDALADLNGQWALTDSIMKSALGAEVASGAAFAGDALPASALPVLEKRGLEYVVLSAASVRSGNSTASTGVYTLSNGTTRALVYDSNPVKAAAEQSPDDFYDALFDRTLSENPDEPVVLRFEIGPGTRDSVESLKLALAWLAETPWTEVVTASDAAAYETPRDGRLIQKLAPRGAPAGYWSEVATARMKADAAGAALGADNAGARSAKSAVYIAQSLCWAGPDKGYALADRGRAFAASAIRYVDDLFATVTIGAQDVTLSNRTGAVPVSVVNGSDKPLKVNIVTTASRISVKSTVKPVTLDIGENVVTIPVDMGSELSDTLDIKLVAGDLMIREATVKVQASYLDRLATLGMVFVFLAGLLWFIRRRVRAADAGTMPGEPDSERQ
jgi:hypothetical protein